MCGINYYKNCDIKYCSGGNILKVKNANMYPRWLDSLLCIENSDQGHPQCKKHNGLKASQKTSKNHFCMYCCARICEICIDEDHKECEVGNKVLQLRLATQDSTQDGTISKNLTIEEKSLIKVGIPLTHVQHYIFNAKRVYYIFHRPSRKKNTFACKICGHKFLTNEHKYCSLQCMVAATSDQNSQVEGKIDKISLVEAHTSRIANQTMEALFIASTSDTNLETKTNINSAIEEQQQQQSSILKWTIQMKRLQQSRPKRDASQMWAGFNSIIASSNTLPSETLQMPLPLDSIGTSLSNTSKMTLPLDSMRTLPNNTLEMALPLDSIRTSPSDTLEMTIRLNPIRTIPSDTSEMTIPLNSIRKLQNRRKQSMPIRSPF